LATVMSCRLSAYVSAVERDMGGVVVVVVVAVDCDNGALPPVDVMACPERTIDMPLSHREWS
jgi:hypothetical protein